MVKQPHMLALPRSVIHGGGLVLLFVTTLLLSHQNFMLYHAGVDFFCVFVAWSIFSSSSSTHRYSNDSYFMFLGIAYLFIGVLGFLYALVNARLGIFHTGEPVALTHQLWISVRIFEAISIFTSTFILTRTIKAKAVFSLYLFAFTIIMLLIFQWQVLPPGPIDGSLTTTHILVTYFTAALLLASIILTIKKRTHFPSQGFFLRMVAAYTIALMASLSFTFIYPYPQSFWNFLGHLLRLTSYILIRSALLEVYVHRPYLKLLEVNKLLSEEITQRQASEAQKLRYEHELHKLSKLESIASVAGGLSHDFKNLLTIILGNADLARMRTDNELIRNNLKHISNAALQGAELANRLLTFTRDDSPHMKPLNIGSVVQKTTQLALSGTNVIAEYSLPDNPAWVEADSNQISQVIHNIVINAIQAMPQGGLISIKVFQEYEENLPISPGKYAVISIEDQGVGINQEDLDHIFVPFFTTKEDGSGMGLATSFYIIKNHNGHITTSSTPGQGSIFNIYLPLLTPGTKVAEEVAAAYSPEEKQ